MVTVIILAGVIAYLMLTNFPQDGLYLAEIAPYYSRYLLILLAGLVMNRLLVSGLFRAIYFKQQESEPWRKEESDLLAEYSGIVNGFVIVVLGLALALALMVFNQTLPWFFITLFLVILAAELTLLGSTIYYHIDKEE